MKRPSEYMTMTDGVTQHDYKQALNKYIDYLEAENKQLILSGVVKSDSEQLHTEVFNLANKLAINGYGNEAVKMHGICNGM